MGDRASLGKSFGPMSWVFVGQTKDRYLLLNDCMMVILIDSLIQFRVTKEGISKTDRHEVDLLACLCSIVLITLTGLGRPSLIVGGVIPYAWILNCIEKEKII